MDENLQIALKQGLIAGLIYGASITWFYDDVTRGLLTGIPFTIFMVGLFWYQNKNKENKN